MRVLDNNEVDFVSGAAVAPGFDLSTIDLSAILSSINIPGVNINNGWSGIPNLSVMPTAIISSPMPGPGPGGTWEDC